MSVCKILSLKNKHAPDLVLLDQICFDHHWIEKDFYIAENRFGFVLYQDNELCGCLLCQFVLDELEILTLDIHPHHRQKGYAKKLFKKLFESCEKRKIKTILLEVQTDNTPALCLYQKYGFEKTGIRKNYYHIQGQTFDAFTMKKDL